MNELTVKRIFESAESADGYRVLIDRLWPRGVAKAAAKLDEWNKDVAPTGSLRIWFGHKPENFPLFKERYMAELDANPAAKEFAARCNKLLQSQNVTLLYGARDPQCNHAVILREWLSKAFSALD